MNRIEQLQRKIQILKDAVEDTTTSESIKTFYIEEIEDLENQILSIHDNEDVEPDSPEYLERQQQDMDTIKDLEDAQR